MIAVAFFTLLERKLLGYFQIRKGPNKPGYLGLFVPFADATKLIAKENNKPKNANQNIFMYVPLITLLIPLLLWIVYPSPHSSLHFSYSLLWFISVASVGVFVLLGAGWSRNRKYSLLGAVRAVAQSISYEVALSIIVIHSALFFAFPLYNDKLSSLGPPLFFVMSILFVTILAETNRSPFDFSEGESELVSGYNTEYSSVPFVIIFLAEYISIIFISAVMRLIFNGTSYFDSFLFLVLWCIVFVWSRGTLPRLRYDQLMDLAWKRYLPLVLSSLCLIITL